MSELYQNDGENVALDSGVYRGLPTIVSHETGVLYPFLSEFEGALVNTAFTTVAGSSPVFRVSPTRAFSVDAGTYQSFEHYLTGTCGMINARTSGFALSQQRFEFVESLLSLSPMTTATFPGGQAAINDIIVAYGMTLTGGSSYCTQYVCSNVEAVRSTAVWQILTSTLGNRVLLIEASTYNQRYQRACSSRFDGE